MLETSSMIQLVAGAVGSAGFGILFHIKRKYLSLAAVGGFLCWFVFLVCREQIGGIFFPTLVAGFVVDLYAEILARTCHETSTSFFVTSVIPLIPGSTLYYCMRSIVEGSLNQAWNYGRDTFLYALGIAAGMSIAWALCDFSRKIQKRREKNGRCERKN